MNVLWYLTAPDGPYPWSPQGARRLDYAYFQQLARAYDHLGFTGALLATGPHDVWVMGSAVLPFTERMRFLAAVHPGLISPVLLAKMAATFQEFSRGRLLINVVSGDARALAAHGLTLSHDGRYELAHEYLTVWHELMAGGTVDFDGEHVKAHGARLAMPAGRSIQPPPLWFGGSSDAAVEVAARHVDTYLSWGEPPASIAGKVAQVKARAAELGRELSYGVRLYVIVRESDGEAWAQAQWLFDRMDEQAIGANQGFVSATDSVGQQRMTALHGGRKPADLRELEIAPNLWAGIGLVRPGPGTAIVGSPETVVRTLEAYREVGVDTFILSGMPLLEEAYRFAELVLPRLPVHREEVSTKTFTWSNFWDRDTAGAGGKAKVG